MSIIGKYELSLKVLEYLSTQRNYVLKQNIISEPSSGMGNLERHFNITLSQQGKNILVLVILDLQEKGLIEAVFKDMMNSGNDLVITDKGKSSLKKKSLDELDDLLLSLNTSDSLVDKRYGAYDVCLSKTKDWQSQAANSLVELIDSTLRVIAPDDKIDKASIDKTKKGEIRKKRITVYLDSKSKSAVAIKAFQLTESVRDRLQAVKHNSNNTSSEVEKLLKLTEDALYYLLQ